MNNLSPEQRFGIVDPNFETTSLYWRTAHLPKGSQRFRVLAGLRDTGEANAVIPVLDELSRRSFDVFVMASERGEDELRTSEFEFSSSRYFDPVLRIERMRGNAVITGYSGVPSIEMVLNSSAHVKGVKVFAIEDYPGAYLSELGKIFNKAAEAIPDYLFVMNEWAKRTNLDCLPSFPEDRIIVSGAPALDKIAHTDKLQVRKEVREKLGVSDDETLISWFGQVGGATVESLQVLMKGLEAIGPENFRLAARFHPRDNTPKEIYDGILRHFRGRFVDAGRDVERNAGRVIAASDLVVQERSTIAMQAAAWEIPVISIAIPEINDRYGVMMGLRVPVIEDGISPLVAKEEEMARVLETALFDSAFRSDLKSRMLAWKSDGKAAERVADKIIELIT